MKKGLVLANAPNWPNAPSLGQEGRIGRARSWWRRWRALVGWRRLMANLDFVAGKATATLAPLVQNRLVFATWPSGPRCPLPGARWPQHCQGGQVWILISMTLRLPREDLLDYADKVVEHD